MLRKNGGRRLGITAILACGVPSLWMTARSSVLAADLMTPWREAGVVSTAASPHARLRAVPIRAVRMEDGFWRPRMEANRRTAIPRLLQLLEEHGVVDNFRRLSGRKQCDRRGYLFTDSDLYKWMEAVALVLQSTPDDGLRAKLEAIIDDVLAAQGPDGYLNTWFVDDRAGQRWTRLGSDHELYCAGHLFQAAIAHHRATGERKLLDGAIRFADYLCATFGPDKKVQGFAGHPEIEMALVELYRTTGDRKYLDLADYFLRGAGFLTRPELTGHAVRQMYLCAGGADYYMETGNRAYLDKGNVLWEDLTAHKMYITGGVGSRHTHEAFGEAFELPNYGSYAETCAGIGNAMWNWRMLAIAGGAKHADVLEASLYNGFLSGVSLDGDEYFYVNPLASRGGHQRVPWYDCTCCPPNVQRTLAAIPGQIFSTTDEGVHVHLYDNCRLEWRLKDESEFTLTQKTRYPWDGQVTLQVSPKQPARFAINLRIPRWCREVKVSINGTQTEAATKPGTYCRLPREWKAGDEVVLDLTMPVMAVGCDERVAENRDRVAVARGPLVYCFEGVDHAGLAMNRLGIRIDPQTQRPLLTATHEPQLLSGVTALRGRGFERDKPSGGCLYHFLSEDPAASTREVDLTAIPYYAWANRDKAPMVVWVPFAPAAE